MIVVAARGRKGEAHRLRVFLQPRRQVLERLDRRVGLHCENDVLAREDVERREIGVVELARAHQLVADHRR